MRKHVWTSGSLLLGAWVDRRVGSVKMTAFLLPPVVSIFHFMTVCKIITSLGDPDVFPCLRCNDPCVGLYTQKVGCLFVWLFFVLLIAWDHFLINERCLCLFFYKWGVTADANHGRKLSLRSRTYLDAEMLTSQSLVPRATSAGSLYPYPLPSPLTETISASLGSQR